LEQTTAWPVGDLNAATRPSHNLMRNCEPEPGTRNILAARGIGTEEGFEDLTQYLFWDARAVVLNGHAGRCCIPADADPRANTMCGRIDYKVAQGAV
jgi:hypothetical protein